MNADKTLMVGGCVDHCTHSTKRIPGSVFIGVHRRSSAVDSAFAFPQNF
jgi:hypothetical protein